MTRFLPLALAVVVALTAQAFGAAHGLRWTGQTMDICRGSGVAVVPVPGSTDGQVHLCPDAAIAQFTDTSDAPAHGFAPVLIAWAAPTGEQPNIAPAPLIRARARSPPLS